MLQLGRTVRLTAPEIERFTKLTGFSPDDVKTLDDLDAYIAHCKRYYVGVTEDTHFLHWLIDQERSACLGVA
jgi:hypothetical protein